MILGVIRQGLVMCGIIWYDKVKCDEAKCGVVR